MIGKGPAFAADLGAAPYDRTPAYIVPVYNWSGVYIGVNLGYGWGRSTDTSSLVHVNVSRRHFARTRSGTSSHLEPAA